MKIKKPDYSMFRFHFNDVIFNNKTKKSFVTDAKIISGNLVIDLYDEKKNKRVWEFWK